MFYITATSSTAQVYRPNVFVTLVTWRRGRVQDAEAASYWLISYAGRGRSPQGLLREKLKKTARGAEKGTKRPSASDQSSPKSWKHQGRRVGKALQILSLDVSILTLYLSLYVLHFNICRKFAKNAVFYF